MGYRLSTIFLDILAPRVCVGCRSEGSWCCTSCVATMTREPNVTCLGCLRVSLNGATCDRCRSELKLDSVTAVAPYTDSIIQRLIHLVKYAPARDVASAFGTILARVQFPREVVDTTPIIVPVPLHWRREMERGFNQSRILAGVVADAVSGRVVDALVRTRRTNPQVELVHEQRGVNVEGAFACREPHKVRGRSVLLVDDVVTTGATMGESARALRAAGARSVHGFALARG